MGGYRYRINVCLWVDKIKLKDAENLGGYGHVFTYTNAQIYQNSLVWTFKGLCFAVYKPKSQLYSFQWKPHESREITAWVRYHLMILEEGLKPSRYGTKCGCFGSSGKIQSRLNNEQ